MRKHINLKGIFGDKTVRDMYININGGKVWTLLAGNQLTKFQHTLRF